MKKCSTTLLAVFAGLFYLISFSSCSLKSETNPQPLEIDSTLQIEQVQRKVMPGAENLASYIPLLKGKRVALVVNHSSRVGDKHLLDTLLALEVNVVKLFSPEHGFKGSADAGEKIADRTLKRKKEIPLVSLYGSKLIPTQADMEGLDIVVFDIQDVGVRFYTYISTMHYVMEACADAGIPLIVLDRPNPNGHYVDGPVLKPPYTSFVGMHQIPVVYGMTIGELALMINGEGWLDNSIKCDLKVVKNSNYTHLSTYKLPVPPSPNLPDMLSIYLYPSLCFFEGTPISVGRGTDRPFTKIGHPDFRSYSYSFTPFPINGASKPKHNGLACFGYDLGTLSQENVRAKSKLNLEWFLEFHANWKRDEAFFYSNGWFDKLAGTEVFRQQILANMTEEEIRNSWLSEIEDFKSKRRKYLLYPDFE